MAEMALFADGRRRSPGYASLSLTDLANAPTFPASLAAKRARASSAGASVADHQDPSKYNQQVEARG